MVAEFYIVAESFQENGDLNSQEIEAKIISLAKDFSYIKQYREENRLLIHPDIYSINFINGYTISDLVNNHEGANGQMDRDARNMLKKIVFESALTDCSTSDVIQVLLPEHNENLCHGLIGFNSIDGVDASLQIVYNRNGWFNFKRYFLSLYPGTPNFFINECIKYYPDCHFHDHNRESIRPILGGFAKKITYHLSALNDRFKESNVAPRNRQQVLDHFKVNCRLDENSTLEGDASRKHTFTYEFMSNDGGLRKVCCEPHLKLCKSDDAGDSHYYYNRIYFHEGFADIENGKILVGHIGQHR